MNENRPIAVVGAGAAGLASAISVADQGATVVLIEKTPYLGGTVTQSLIHTIGGLYDDAGEYINQGLPVALGQQLEAASVHTTKRKIGKTWTLSVDPAVYEQVVEAWIARKPNITVYRNSHLTHVHEENGVINAVELSTQTGKCTLYPRALIDTTGTAEITGQINPQLVIPGEALAGLIFQLRGVDQKALRFPQNVVYLRAIQQAVEEGRLPSACARIWFDVGIYADEIYVKLNLPATLLPAQALLDLPQRLVDYLREFPPFSTARMGRVGRLGIRDGGRIKGEYCLTVADVRNGRSFSDAVCHSAWPIEYWDPQEGLMLEYLPANQSYQIPVRALQVAGMKNLWAVGKCLSAEKLAQSSARVAGTCWAMGDGLGKVVATHEFI